jgi:hypothetical protein
MGRQAPEPEPARPEQAAAPRMQHRQRLGEPEEHPHRGRPADAELLLSILWSQAASKHRDRPERHEMPHQAEEET